MRSVGLDLGKKEVSFCEVRDAEEARTKLLGEIWHKHGFIHPGERPRAPN